jgi:D-alanyl-D-alanine endopeptidase (penicillin-binding protein 7)
MKTRLHSLSLGLLSLVVAAALSVPVEALANRPAAKKSAASAVARQATKPGRPVARGAAASKRRVVATGRSGQRSALRRVVHIVEPARLSFGQLQGLHGQSDPLELKSSVALVLDQDTNEVLFAKNTQAVLPIASITKLMTALVVAESQQNLHDTLEISQDDVDLEKGSRSRLRPGTQLSRGEMLHLALMSSENRAANALGRHYPGGMDQFVAAMNRKAVALGMRETRFVEPTGLSSSNQSSAHDLAVLVRAAYKHPLLRDMSTSPDASVAVGDRVLQFHNTNALVKNPQWEIGLQKTGYISEAGRCLVMQAHLVGRKLIMVFLDSAGKYSRLGDAERVRRWLTEAHTSAPAAGTQPTT